MLRRPLLAHSADGDPAQRVTGGGMEDGEVEVAHEEAEGDVHQPVVEQDGAREAEPRVALAEPQQQAGSEEQHGERRGQRGVDLLARVEAALWGVLTAEPAEIVAVEAVDLARGAEDAAPVTEQDDEGEGADPRDAGPEVDVLDEWPAADLDGEARQVQHEARADQHEEGERVHPVQRALGAREATDVAHAPLERPTQASSS